MKHRWCLRCLLLLMPVAVIEAGFGNDAQASSEDAAAVSAETLSVESEPVEQQIPAELTPEQKEQRRQLVSVMWIMLTGVVVLGVVAVLFAIVWGARMRRITRTPSPEASLKKEFWYLNQPGDQPVEADSESVKDGDQS